MGRDWSSHNRAVANKRWKRVREKYKNHLKSIRGTPTYYLHKARLLGYLAGDGHVKIREEIRSGKQVLHYHIRFYPDDEQMMQAYLHSFETLYQETPHRIRHSGHWEVRICHQVACKDLLDSGSLGTWDWRVPFAELLSAGAICEWLRAYFDAEAYVNDRYIRVESVNKKGLLEVRELLDLLNITAAWYVYERKKETHGTNYILCILDAESQRRFEKHIGFFHKKKARILKELNAATRI